MKKPYCYLIDNINKTEVILNELINIIRKDMNRYISCLRFILFLDSSEISHLNPVQVFV